MSCFRTLNPFTHSTLLVRVGNNFRCRSEWWSMHAKPEARLAAPLHIFERAHELQTSSDPRPPTDTIPFPPLPNTSRPSVQSQSCLTAKSRSRAPPAPPSSPRRSPTRPAASSCSTSGATRTSRSGISLLRTRSHAQFHPFEKFWEETEVCKWKTSAYVG